MTVDDPQELGAHPSIEVRGPQGGSATVALTGRRVRVGREDKVNDIVLGPDPQRFVSVEHCRIEREGGVWRVIDETSTNGTMVRREDEEVEVLGVEGLSHGDVICILAGLSESGPTYWELVFRNPTQTVPVAARARAERERAERERAQRAGATRLEYDWPAARLTRIVGGRHDPLPDLPPKVHDLLVYLLTRNRDNGDMPVLCSQDELMQAIWRDDTHAVTELSGLILELRKRIEVDPKQPRFVQTVKKRGYRLDPRPPAP